MSEFCELCGEPWTQPMHFCPPPVAPESEVPPVLAGVDSERAGLPDDSVDLYLSALKQQHSAGHGPCGCLQPATCTSAKYLAIVERQQQDAAGLRVQLASALQRWEHAVREWDDLQRRWDAAEREGAEWRTVAERNQDLLTRAIEKLSSAERERDLALGELAAAIRERLRAIEWDEATDAKEGMQ